MCKKFFYLFSVLLLSFTCTCYADVVVGDWENGSYDGWIDWGSGQGTIESIGAPKYTFSEIGATSGGSALKVSPGGGWQQNLSISLADVGGLEAFMSGTAFAIDVTYNSADWDPAATYAQVYQVSFNNNGFGWNDVGGAGAPTGAAGVVFTDTLNPDSPGNIPLVDPGTEGTTITGTWTWDYSGVIDKFTLPDTDAYIQIVMATNSDAPGAYYFDNARIVGAEPEPELETLIVGSAADTWMVSGDPNAHGDMDYMVLHGGSVDRTGYMRFDLSGLNIESISSATLTLTVNGSIPKPPYRNDTVVNGRFALYGLNNVAGNTPQDWDEAVLTSDGTGAEMDWTTGEVIIADGQATDLDDDVPGISETVTNADAGGWALGTTITITGDALVSFLQSRVDDNGLVTFILKNDDGSDRGYGICSKEYTDEDPNTPDEAYRPVLELSAVTVEPAPTAAIIVNPAELSSGFDLAQHDRLVAMGYEVTVVPQGDVGSVFTIDNANAFDLLIISESISSSRADPLRGTTTPAMHNEGYGWDNWYMTTGAGAGWQTGDGINVDIVNDTHPIAVDAGVSAGPLAFYSTGDSWTCDLVSSLAPGAELVAQITVDSADYAVIFTIDKGAELTDGSGAAARIAGFSITGSTTHDASGMTKEAWALWDATIRWLNPPAPELEVAGELLVDVSAADPSAGTAVWVNYGTLGDFNFVTADTLPAGSKPTGVGALGVNLTVELFEDVPVVKVNSASETLAAYVGPLSVPGIEGDGDRSVEAWVADDEIPKAQTIIAWGRRGGNPEGSNEAFGYGYKTNFGAVGHWGDGFDCAWTNDWDGDVAEELPSTGTLHHLVYTAEANIVKLYVDGALVVTREMDAPLSTHAVHTINLFVENNDASGALSNSNLPSGLLVNSIRVHDGVLTDAQVLNNYLAGPAQ